MAAPHVVANVAAVRYFNEEVARAFGPSVVVDLSFDRYDNAWSVGTEDVSFAMAKGLCRIFQRLNTRTPTKK